MELEFSGQIFDRYSNFMKIRAVGAELYHADGQTEGHDEANSRFSQICERVPKNSNMFRLMDTDNTKGMNHHQISLILT
jgi:hypothetical protein